MVKKFEPRRHEGTKADRLPASLKLRRTHASRKATQGTARRRAQQRTQRGPREVRLHRAGGGCVSESLCLWFSQDLGVLNEIWNRFFFVHWFAVRIVLVLMLHTALFVRCAFILDV